MVSWWWAAILGFIISLSTMSMAGRYVSMFFMASGYVGKALIPQGNESTEKASWISQRFCNYASLGIECHFAASGVRQPLHILSLKSKSHFTENVRQPLVSLMALATSEACMSLCSLKNELSTFVDAALRMGSFTWKATWGPEYHQSMVISLCALVISTLLALGQCNSHQVLVGLSECSVFLHCSYSPNSGARKSEA